MGRPRLIATALAMALAGVLVACGGAKDKAAQPGGDVSSLTPPANSTPTVQAEDFQRLGFSMAGWKTDFRRHSVPLAEISSGGPSKDGIPAIDKPKFNSVPEADRWLDDREPVQVLGIEGEVGVYPFQILTWHEIVNDIVGQRPVAVTYCPLCNIAITFDARLTDGRVLDFGTTGNLRFSDLVMYDRQTESWWQQAGGEAIVGELTGTKLHILPSLVVAWSEAKREYPQAKVLSRDTGHSRPYGENPYVGYDSGDPFLYRGPLDRRLPALERVVGIEIGQSVLAIPFSELEKQPVVQDRLAGQAFVVFFDQKTASALGAATVKDGRDVGSAAVYDPEVNGVMLTFHKDKEGFEDGQTGTRWSLPGTAVSGPLAGHRLRPLVSWSGQFWFSWVVFKPNTAIYRK
ncbi:MAG: DUF3179 domain-containing protein [Chloroflexi bacterium]|nr:DUF3179 domain-containing protein [Chloroflexota bacterium]